MDRHTDLKIGMEVTWEDIKVKFEGQGHRSKVNVIQCDVSSSSNSWSLMEERSKSRI